MDSSKENCVEDTAATDTLTSLKLELACRKSNEHSVSGLGGDDTEYLFILTHELKAVDLDDGASPYFERASSREVVLFAPKNPNLREIREVFSKFLEEQYPERLIVVQGQLLKDQRLAGLADENPEVKLLLQAANLAHQIASSLDKKIPSMDPLRAGKLEDLIPSSKDTEMIKELGKYPPHITLFAFRTYVGIERAVVFNLDEHIPDFFVKINNAHAGRIAQ